MIISQLLDGSGEVFHVSSQFQKGPRAHRRILLVFEPCPKPSALEIPNQSVTFSFLNSIQVGLLSSDFDQCDLFQKQMAYFRKQTVAPSLSPLVAFGVWLRKTVWDQGKKKTILLLETLENVKIVVRGAQGHKELHPRNSFLHGETAQSLRSLASMRILVRSQHPCEQTRCGGMQFHPSAGKVETQESPGITSHPAQKNQCSLGPQGETLSRRRWVASEE